MQASAKLPFGIASYSPVKHARYLGWEWRRVGRADIDCSKAAVHGEVDGQQLRQDAFDVEFDDGLSFLEPHKTIRKANKISLRAVPKCVSVPKKFRTHFKIEYDSGEVAEVSWSFIREFPPKK